MRYFNLEAKLKTKSQMQTLEHIRKPIEVEMRNFEIKFQEAMKSRVALIDRIMLYIVKRKGKQIRPMLVFLSAGVAGTIQEKTYRGAALVELLHTATLIHDDIVDDSLQRRGFFSINALWKNKIAVLVGDYLLSRGLLLSVDNGDFDLLKISSEAVKAMSEGELLQLEKSRNLNYDEEVYYDIIKKKTASLIASCCAMGARSVTNEEESIEKLRLFGEKVGMAFQIKDDLFDYGFDDTGKPSFTDIKDKKLTLPMIFALKNASGSDRSKTIKIIKSNKPSKEDLWYIVKFVKENGGILYSEEVMKKNQNDAFAILGTFPHSAYRTSLEELVIYTTSRNK